ncbi:hypothetical protein [Treponema zioleckii]|uniref:hypothetical protein n=1 Tax=Treponema zioleckii TaxID=331680 RepID=UPI00168AF3D0|nr:hypothetical protein [Treponema zioleckii]
MDNKRTPSVLYNHRADKNAAAGAGVGLFYQHQVFKENSFVFVYRKISQPFSFFYTVNAPEDFFSTPKTEFASPQKGVSCPAFPPLFLLVFNKADSLVLIDCGIDKAEYSSPRS